MKNLLAVLAQDETEVWVYGPLGMVLPHRWKKNSGWWWCTWIDWNLIKESLGTSALKKGAVVVGGEWTPLKTEPQENETKCRPQKKERWYTNRLFGTNSLKKGTLWRNMNIC
jgi:hypothetical protein